MIRRLTVLLLLLSGGLAVPGGYVISTVLLRSGGLTRSYVVVRPAHPSGPLPVLVELHGCCTTPWAELARSGFVEATGGAAVLVYPAGYDERWNAGACCGNQGVDDVAFITAVIRRVSPRSPVYLVGYSNGGRMAYRLACERPELFAAVAVFGAVSAFPCPNPSPVPILIAAGTDDPELTVPAAGIPHMVGGLLEPSVTGQAEIYAAANGCRGLAGCGSVVLRLYPGAGHAWPPDLAAVIWSFFRGRALASRPPASHVTVCPRGQRIGKGILADLLGCPLLSGEPEPPRPWHSGSDSFPAAAPKPHAAMVPRASCTLR
ncbi:MAG TPA: dienelactone hydrolase family protein [Actinoplanes sp.]